MFVCIHGVHILQVRVFLQACYKDANFKINLHKIQSTDQNIIYVHKSENKYSNNNNNNNNKILQDYIRYTENKNNVVEKKKKRKK